ncbi:type IV pilin [Haloarcula sediminis]|uniref:type IV pilin n=1 Tax=Haloarcula sediminis TaxID=3111777 RepID=UPI002D77D3C4|nr:type IV pilin [Haloarcula sp. CK38]
MCASRESGAGTRAASTVIGVVLLTAVVVLLSTLVGGVVLSNITAQSTGNTLVKCDTEYTDGAVRIQHIGGDAVDTSSLTLVFRNTSATARQLFEIDTGDPERFETGDVAVYGSLARTTEVSVVTEDSIVCSGTVEPVTAAPPDTSTPTPPPDTPTPPLTPTLAGYQLQDNTENSNVEYELFYDIDNTEAFDRVEVRFDNRGTDYGDRTVVSGAERGSVSFSQGGREGSTYDITVEVYDTDGTVTDSTVITDTADGRSQSSGDLTEGTSPSFVGTVVDDLGGSEANYETSYNVTDRADFGYVEVQYENLDRGWADSTYTSMEQRTNVDTYADDSNGGTRGDEYRVSLRLYDTDGVIVDERIVTDVADGTDPSGNDDLTRVSSPTLESYSIQDRTENNNGDYQVQYRVSNPNADFTAVDVVFDNQDNPYSSARRSSSDENGAVQFRQGGVEGDTYDITIRVRDADGVVVDERVITDTADGTDP